MIIGIDASRANQDNKTGVGWYAYHLIQSLKQLPRDNNVTFVLYTDKPLTGELAELPEGWSAKVLRWPPRRLWTQLRLSWEMLLHRPDVLFVPAHVPPLIHPKKTVMTLHDVAALRFPESYNWFERWYTTWSAKFALKNLWKIIVPTTFIKKQLLEHFSSAQQEKITPIHHGVSSTFAAHYSAEEVATVLKKYSITSPFILSIGRLEHKKNSTRIIQAFDTIQATKQQELTLVLVGKPGHGYEEVAHAIEHSPNKEHILNLGWVAQKDLPIILQAAEVFVFPSLYEGFGLPVLEAFAAQTPVIAAKGHSLEEVGGNAVHYVNPQDVSDIAAGIALLREDKHLSNTLIEKGTNRLAQFSWEACAKKTMDILSSPR